MNERIRKLAEEADELADKQIQMPGEYHPDWGDIRDQKFAELIVRECATIADQCADRGSWIAGYRMKLHFGVY